MTARIMVAARTLAMAIAQLLAVALIAPSATSNGSTGAR